MTIPTSVLTQATQIIDEPCSTNAEVRMTAKIPLHISRATAAAAPIPTGWRSAEVLRHGTLELRWFAPPAIGLDHDAQKPHSRDEVYIIASGSGRFVRGEESVTFGPGDALFVPARTAHLDMTRARALALTVFSSPMFFVERKQLAGLAVKNRPPAVHPSKEFVDAGGLMSDGPDMADLFRRAPTYEDGAGAHNPAVVAGPGRPGHRIAVINQRGQLLRSANVF